MKTMEINVRAAYSFQSIGVGHTSLTKLCGFLNMAPPMTKNAYDALSYSIKVASKQVTEKSLSDAAARLRGTEPTADIGVSVDCTWQRKGFSSALGVVAAISIDNEKVLDVAIHSFLDIMELLKIDPDCYMTKCYRFINVVNLHL